LGGGVEEGHGLVYYEEKRFVQGSGSGRRREEKGRRGGLTAALGKGFNFVHWGRTGKNARRNQIDAGQHFHGK